jgi:hypothetical protein
MQLTIPDKHVHDLRFALAEQVERDEDLICQAEEQMPSADTSRRRPADRVLPRACGPGRRLRGRPL